MKRGYKLFTVKAGPHANSKVLFKGDHAKTSEFCGCSEKTLYEHEKDGLPIWNQYWVTADICYDPRPRTRLHDFKAVKKEVKAKAKEPKLSKKKQEYLRILKHLDIYGNTGTQKDPIKVYGDAFEKDGYIIDVYHKPRMVFKRRAGDWEREVWDESWIITLIKKVDPTEREGEKK